MEFDFGGVNMSGQVHAVNFGECPRAQIDLSTRREQIVEDILKIFPKSEAGYVTDHDFEMLHIREDIDCGSDDRSALTCNVYPDYINLTWISVNPKHRCKGIAGKIIEYLLLLCIEVNAELFIDSAFEATQRIVQRLAEVHRVEINEIDERSGDSEENMVSFQLRGRR